MPVRGSAFERFYEHRVAPALLSESGCVFARLIKSTEDETDFISFTLWESPEAAMEYEESGRYKSLVSENHPFLEDSTEWKIQLTPENTLEYLPVQEEPEVKAMPDNNSAYRLILRLQISVSRLTQTPLPVACRESPSLIHSANVCRFEGLIRRCWSPLWRILPSSIRIAVGFVSRKIMRLRILIWPS